MNLKVLSLVIGGLTTVGGTVTAIVKSTNSSTEKSLESSSDDNVSVSNKKTELQSKTEVVNTKNIQDPSQTIDESQRHQTLQTENPETATNSIPNNQGTLSS